VGWNEEIQVLVHNKVGDVAEVMNIGSSQGSPEKKLLVLTNYTIEPEIEKPVFVEPRYQLKPMDDPQAVSREEFNRLFDTDIVVLPTNLYAAGIQGDKFYMYNESYMQFYNIIYGIKFIMRVAKSFTPQYNNFYFIISACDGYFEKLYYSPNRTTPIMIGETECKDTFINFNVTDEEYPVYHKKKYIVAQSHHKNMPFAIDAIDKHYLYHNYYNCFRSYHYGIPFHLKQNKIIYAGQERGYNTGYFSRRDIELKPRDYFKQVIAPKYPSFIVAPTGWVERKEQSMNYKYQLLIDGNSSCWDKQLHLLNGGSVILYHQSPWRQWYYTDTAFIPNVHFVEIKEDFSDIEERFIWCENHQTECLQMIQNCKNLFQEVVNIRNVFKHTMKIIEQLQ
jgi:hypothetical protein